MLLDAETAEPVPTRGANAVDARVCLGCYEKAMARRQQKSGDEKRRAEGKSSMTEPGRTETETGTETEAAAATSGGDGETSGGDGEASGGDAATRDGGGAATSDGGDAAMSDGGDAGSDAAMSDGSATRDFDASEAPRDGSAAGSSARQRSASGSFAPAAPPSSSPPSFGAAGPVPVAVAEEPAASSPTAASLARLARTSALLLAETPSTPDGLASASGARLSGLVARYSSQLREHRRVADDAVGALDAERAAHAATERALALARAQLTRNGALWEELTEARAALERERRRARKQLAGAEGGGVGGGLRPTPTKNATGTNGAKADGGGGDEVCGGDSALDAAPSRAKRSAAAAAKPLLARVAARWVSEKPTSGPETSTTSPDASANEEPFRPCVAWLDVPGWNSAARAEGAAAGARRFSDAASRRSSSSGGGFGSAADASSSGPAASFRGGSLLVRDERTGAALAGGGSVRFADVRSCSATFDEATGHASFTLFCGAEAAMPTGGAEVPRRLLEVRVDGAVAARRWALEIERRAREAREGEASSTKGA
jgi:hypothetical protein